MKNILKLVLGITMTLAFMACGDKSENNKKSEKVFTMNLAAEPGSLDPQLVTDSLGAAVLSTFLEGLVTKDKDGKLIPAGAESWEKNGLTYTFHLRKGIKWSNGKEVTAKDYVFGWKRTLEPETGSQFSYIMYSVKNAEKFNDGEINDFSQVGVKAKDDYTLEVTLERPTPYFISLLMYPCYLPLNEEFYNAQDDEFGLEVENFLYNGPYTMTKWSHGDRIEVEKNPNYWNKDRIKLDKINILMINDTNTALRMYENNELDMVGLTGDSLPKYADSPLLKTYSDGSIWYVAFNTKKKPFNNIKVRRAIGMSIDRQTLVDTLKKDGSIATKYFVPEGIAGPNGKTFRDVNGEEVAPAFNPEKAKELLKEGLAEEGMEGPLSFSVLVGNSDTAQKEAQFYQEQLNKNLGVEVKLEPVTFQIRLQRSASGDFDTVLSGWSADYNDPLSYLDLFLGKGTNNIGKYSNAEYDSLIRLAQNSDDNEKRMEALGKAEKILMDEMAIIPSYSRARNRLIKPEFTGMQFSSVGGEYFFLDLDKKTEEAK